MHPGIMVPKANRHRKLPESVPQLGHTTVPHDPLTVYTARGIPGIWKNLLYTGRIHAPYAWIMYVQE